jgi:ABC-type multidrug transport system fused ATPase/permease subunit
MPRVLQRATLRVFAFVVFQAILEVAAVVAISVVAVGIAAPDRLIFMMNSAGIFQLHPSLDLLSRDSRILSVVAATGAAILVAAKNGITAYVNFMIFKQGERIALFAGDVLFQHYLYSSYTEHLNSDSRIMFQALGWRKQLAHMVTLLMIVYTYMAITLALCLPLICFTPPIIICVMIVMGGAAALVYKKLKASIDQSSKRVAEFAKGETKITLSAMRGIRETLIYRQQKIFFERYRQVREDGVTDRAFLALAPPMPTWILETMGFLIIAGILGMFVLEDASSARISAVLTMIMLTAWRILPLLNRSLSSLVSVRSSRYAAMECLSRVKIALENPATIPPEPAPDFTFQKRIQLQQVTFRYPSAEADCLKKISFTIPSGSRVGIVGRSGAGKSTLVAILSGLIDPSQGELLVDGKSLTPSELSAYRQQIGYVPQQPYIMGGSIAENVAFSQWGKPWDGDQVLKACRMAEFDIAFERGIDAQLGQDGAGLSGGQAQRLSIARALYANPSILILDEATSALDSGVEKTILDTIYTLPDKITTVTIAHRLTTVERCDILIWIENGEVQMIGSPEKVLPEYQAVLNNQKEASASSFVKSQDSFEGAYAR